MESPGKDGVKDRGRRSGVLVVTVAMAAVACNLRPALTSVSPVLTEIQRSTGLSSAGAGLLTTLPVLAFGAFAPAAPVLGRRAGIERTIVVALGVVAAGIVVRSVPGLGFLFAGTVLVGIAIAVANVLVPALIKRDFPLDPRVATGIYSAALSAGAAVAAGVTVPVAHALGGWREGLSFWAIPAVLCLGLWTTRLRSAHRDVGSVHVGGGMWRDRVAWQVTAFMGLQSLGFYAMVAWLPTIFEQHGVDPSAAGWLLSLSGFASLPAAYAAPVVASTARRQRVAVVLTVALDAAAIAGLLWRPTGGAVAWMILLGLAQGAGLALALSFIVGRAPDARRAAELSGMAQTVGYLLAGFGPLVLGVLRDASGSWTLPLVVLVAVLAPEVGVGLGAARPRSVVAGTAVAGAPPKEGRDGSAPIGRGSAPPVGGRQGPTVEHRADRRSGT